MEEGKRYIWNDLDLTEFIVDSEAVFILLSLYKHDVDYVTTTHFMGSVYFDDLKTVYNHNVTRYLTERDNDDVFFVTVFIHPDHRGLILMLDDNDTLSMFEYLKECGFIDDGFITMNAPSDRFVNEMCGE